MTGDEPNDQNSQGKGHDPKNHDRRFHGQPERLRSAERLVLLDVERVVSLSLEGLEARSALDVGCGTGLFTEAFINKGVDTTGVDVNAEMLVIARNEVPSAQFREASAEKLPFNAGVFDLVFFGHLLHETDEPLEALKEAHRVAIARVVVLEWPYRHEEQGPPLAHRLRPEVIEDLARQAGFSMAEHIQLKHVDLFRLRP
ncbi:MAG: class I SAM-dependent methyltransferase [Actinobacteria bacterium]|nr:class I SAM-dependent methyltransferase [Actinomycetota bacterium]MCL5882497.1 class I SAM-dependent methyltransferase [Actinomycetota bacterium]